METLLFNFFCAVMLVVVVADLASRKDGASVEARRHDGGSTIFMVAAVAGSLILLIFSLFRRSWCGDGALWLFWGRA